MTRLIDADALYAEITGSDNKHNDNLMWEYYADIVERHPTIDPVKNGYVPFGLYEQVKWERDMAISQLNSYGVQFGEKAEVQKVKHGKWEECDLVEYDGRCECVHYHKKGLRCSNCCNVFKKELLWKDNYCQNCGARMDKEE